MKKLLTIILTTFMLIACSNSNGNTITNGSDPVFKGPNVTFTKNDLYNSLKGVDYSYLIICNLVNKVAQLEELNMEEYENAAKETMELYKEIYGYENYDDYGGEEAFKLQLMTDEIISDKAEEYIKSDIENLVATDKPIKAQVAYFTSEANAEGFIKDVNKGSTFDMAALDYGYDYSTQATLYLDSDTSLPLEVKEYINSNTNTGLSDMILSQTSTTDSEGKEVVTDRYYVISIISRDYKDFEEEYITRKVSSVDTNNVLKYIFTDYNIEFNDQDTYNLLNTSYPGVFE